MKVLVTGATGFIGKILCKRLLEEGHQVVAVCRSLEKANLLRRMCPVKTQVISDVCSDRVWLNCLEGVDAVVHLAARVHQMKKLVNENTLCRSINVDMTKSLFCAAQVKGVKKFIFMSTVKVNGEKTKCKPFCERDIVEPIDDYAKSKWEAEQFLTSQKEGPSVFILRPPLVYGPGVKANFKQMVNIAKKGVPLPLLGVKNKRSMVSVFNLVDAIIKCCETNLIGKHRYFVSDEGSLSTPEMLKAIANVVNRPSRLFYLPLWLLSFIAFVANKRLQLSRLTDSLEVDISKIKDELQWSPKYTFEETLNEMVNSDD